MKKGFNKENIKVMMYNDVANDKANPFPGKLFNKASWDRPGEDVYYGCIVDYEGEQVNIKNFK
jgi:legumain